MNNRRADVIHKNATPDFYDHNGPNNKPTDVKGDEEMMILMYKSMPDMKVSIEDIITETDKVASRNI